MSKVRTILLIFLMLTVISVGVRIGYVPSEEEYAHGHATQGGIFDAYVNTYVIDEPNHFPITMEVCNATVGGVTYEGAVVNMVAGRVLIYDQAVRSDTGESTALPSGVTFSATLSTEMHLRAGLTYVAYYRTADEPFKRLPMQSEWAPITLELVENGTNVTRGSLQKGLYVAEDTTATLILRNCSYGDQPYYECGQYQFHIIAIS